MVCVVRSMSHRCQRDIVAVNRNLISRFLQVEEATQGLNRFNQASSLSNAPLQSHLGQLYRSLPTLDFIPCSPPMPGGSPCEIWCWGLQRRTVKTILVMKCVFFFFVFHALSCLVGGRGSTIMSSFTENCYIANWSESSRSRSRRSIPFSSEFTSLMLLFVRRRASLAAGEAQSLRRPS